MVCGPFHRILVTPLLLFALQLVAPADTRPRWRGDLLLGTDQFEAERNAWSLGRATVGYHDGRLGVAADLWSARRFDVTDQGGGIDLALPVGRRTSLYLRGALAPDAAVLPEREGVVEVSTALRRGWDGALRYRRSIYRDREAHAFTVGVGRSRGRWYLRLLGTVVRSDEASGGAVGIRVRRFLDPRRPESSLDFFADAGREIVPLGPLVLPDFRNTTSIGIRWQRPLDPRTGLGLTLYRNTEAQAPSRIGVGIGAYRTW